MSLSHEKLWKLARLSKGDYVVPFAIDRICQELRRDVGDVTEAVLDKSKCEKAEK